MTINIAIAVAEGLVMAADSASQIHVTTPQGATTLAVTYNSAEKLTGLGNLPIAAMVHGIGAIANRSILSLLREFEFEYFVDESAPGDTDDERLAVSAVCDALADFIDTRYTAAFPPQRPAALPPTAKWPPVLGIEVGGYSPRQFFPEVFEIQFPGKKINQKHPMQGKPQGSGSISWWGEGQSIMRLVMGFNAAHYDQVYEAVRAGTLTLADGTRPAVIHNVKPSEVLQPLAPLLQMPLMLDGMPLQDAAEFAEFLGQVAIGYDRFKMGPQAVGGHLDVLAIQPEGLSWYKRKPFMEKMARARSQFYPQDRRSDAHE